MARRASVFIRSPLAFCRSSAPSCAAAAAAVELACLSSAPCAALAANHASVPAASGSHHWPLCLDSSIRRSWVSALSATAASPTECDARSHLASAAGNPHWSPPSAPPAPPAPAPTTRLLFFKSTTMSSISLARFVSPPTAVSASLSAPPALSLSSATRVWRLKMKSFIPPGSSERNLAPAHRSNDNIKVASSSSSVDTSVTNNPYNTLLGYNPHVCRRANTAVRLDAARAFPAARAASSDLRSWHPNLAPSSGPNSPLTPATKAASAAAYCSLALGPSTKALSISLVHASPTARRGIRAESCAISFATLATLDSPMRFISPRTWWKTKHDVILIARTER